MGFLAPVQPLFSVFGDLQGSYFPTFKPTAAMYESAQEGYDLLHLTYRDPEWDPHDVDFSTREEAMLGHDGLVCEPTNARKRNLFPVHLVQQEAMTLAFIDQLADKRVISACYSEFATVNRGRNDGNDHHDGLTSVAVAAMLSMAKPKMDPA